MMIVPTTVVFLDWNMDVADCYCIYVLTGISMYRIAFAYLFGL